MIWLVILALVPVALMMMSSPGGRLTLIMAVALLVFTPGVAAFTPKLVFLALLMGSFVVSVIRLRNADVRLSSGVLASAFFFSVTLLIAAFRGWTADPQATMVNGLPYVLLLLILPIAVDAGLGSSHRLLEATMVTVGLIATTSFAVHWLARRGVSTLDASGLLATSVLMPALVFIWALVTAGDESRGQKVRTLGATISILIPFAFAITGTRSAVVTLAIGFSGFLIWKLLRRQIFRTLSVGVVTVAISIPVLGLLASALVNQPGFLSQRFSALLTALNYGSAGDQSWAMRQYSTQMVQSVLKDDWLFGLGLATPDIVANFDTPLATILRIGIVGNFCLALYFFVVLRWATQIAPQDATGTSIRAIISLWGLVVLSLGLLLNPPSDDRLLPFAFASIVALAVNARVTSDQSRKAISSSEGRSPLEHHHTVPSAPRSATSG